MISRFSRKFMGKFRQVWKNPEGFVGFVWGSGAEPPEANENIKKVVEKSMENCKILKLFMKF